MKGRKAMQLKVFVLPVKYLGAAEIEMNAFLRGHRVLAVKKEFVAEGENSFWNWNDNARKCRSANRNGNNPDNRNNNLGFRAVLAAAQTRRAGLTRPPSCPRSAVFRGKQRWNKARCE